MQKLPFSLVTCGLLMACGAVVVGWMAFPMILRKKVSEKVRLEKDGDTYKKWENIPIPIYMKVHIFNLTNADEVKKGGTPEVNEVGPYVYEQKRKKIDIVYNEDHDSFFYRQPITYYFRPDLSTGSQDDVLTLLNLPFFGVVAKVSKEGKMVQYVVHETLLPLKPQAFVTTTVDEFLFKGRYLEFMKALSDVKKETLLPNNTFGIYYGKNGTDVNGVLEVNAGVKDNSMFGEIMSWRNESELSFWNDDPSCNEISGSDGALFSPFVTKDRKLSIFSPDLCRSLYLTYQEDEEVVGLNGYKFTLPEELLEGPEKNPAHKCYCTDPGKDGEKCPKSGAYQLESCRKGAPLVVSLPHFLDGDPQYQKDVKGLNPVREKHETAITLEPTTGVLLKANKRIQINIQLEKFKLLKAFKKFPTAILPIFWVDEEATLTEASAERLQNLVIKKQKVASLVTWLVFAAGALIALAGAAIYFVRSRTGDSKHKYTT